MPAGRKMQIALHGERHQRNPGRLAGSRIAARPQGHTLRRPNRSAIDGEDHPAGRQVLPIAEIENLGAKLDCVAGPALGRERQVATKAGNRDSRIGLRQSACRHRKRGRRDQRTRLHDAPPKR
jgi:hypothetical protein